MASVADPMQRLAAARASAIFDIDHHLDARQVRGKRCRVHVALGRSIYPLSLIDSIALGLATRCDSLDLFEPEQHLIFKQPLWIGARGRLAVVASTH